MAEAPEAASAPPGEMSADTAEGVAAPAAPASVPTAAPSVATTASRATAPVELEAPGLTGRQEERGLQRTISSTGLRSFAEAAEHETQVVTFQLSKEEYAIDILQVQEIVMIIPITRMPKAPHFIEGVVNLRGQMIPIIDMRKRFSLPEAKHDDDTRIIIVNIGEVNAVETVGMVVDGVRDVIRLPDSAISPPPPMIKGISAEYLKGIGQFNERLLIMLDLERVLTAEEQEILRKLGPDGCPLSVERRSRGKPRAKRASAERGAAAGGQEKKAGYDTTLA